MSIVTLKGAIDKGRKDANKNDRQATEVASAVQQTFENVVMTHLFPDSQIDVFIEVSEPYFSP